MIEELKNQLWKAQESLKDFDKFKHLFSDDDAEVELAEIYHNLKKFNVLLKAQTIKEVAFPTNKALQDGLFNKSGSLVKIRPCAEEYKNKTYVGFYLGDMAAGSSISVTDDKIQLEFSSHNPAIYVPELGKVIYGYESWWGVIKSEKDLESISDEDIDNVWYVKLAKQLLNKKITRDYLRKEGWEQDDNLYWHKDGHEYDEFNYILWKKDNPKHKQPVETIQELEKLINEK